MDISIYFFTLITIINSVQCAKILGIFPSTGYSQFILCKKLMTELAHRGHHVTVISAYKPKEEVNNYTTILTDDLIKETQGDLFSLEDTNVLINNIVFHNFGYLLTEYILSHQEVHRLIHSNETFDLVIVETFANEAHMGFAQHFNAPLVLFSSIGLAELNSHLVGNIMLPSVEPVSFSSFTNHMTFFQRLSNSAFYLFDIIYKELVAFPRQQTFLNKYFPKKMSLTEIMYNASLMLLNSHVSTTHPTFLTTSVIEIGGFHISPKKLPRDLQKFLDEAEYGVILFSMGSNLKSSNIPQDTLNNILKVFSKLKQKSPLEV
ncbi:hypothetical protein NQ314_018038 [Rhamnusium bicolor]|uniref:UDP-glucuronosyltransferase n=1 Tax=Rhamnusium bicolor TaxID=1586634 RepID=A0AAV8WSA9_9CUCU|nr:hypothetical protein NQ314_018038 [Rhamnusium bicolor]